MHFCFHLRNFVHVKADTGYRLQVVTVRKLETESDAFAFGDKLIENWYKTVDKGTNKGVLVVVTTGKDGALTGGPKFLKVLSNSLGQACMCVIGSVRVFSKGEACLRDAPRS